jgi:hypothetical protein
MLTNRSVFGYVLVAVADHITDSSWLLADAKTSVADVAA